MQPSLHRRLLQLALTPALLFALVLCIYFGVSQNWRADRQFEQQAHALTRVLAPAVANGLADQDEQQLEALAREALNVVDSRAFRIWVGDDIIFQRGPHIPFTRPMDLSSVPTLMRQDSYVRVAYPLPLLGDETEAPSPPAWLLMDFSDTDTKLDTYRQTTLGALIALIALGLIWILVLRLGRSITQPFYNIMDTVRALADGNLDRRSRVEKNSELRALSLGVNRLGETLQNSQMEMQQSVDQATQDLRETLETLEIQNIQLGNARRQALEANEAKTQFLANMSHEIRTPLNGVIGFIKLLDKTELNQKQRDYVSTIRYSSEGLMNIINDILDFLKLDAGKLELERRSMNLRDTVEDVLDMLAPMAQEKSLELVALIYDDVPLNVMGDPLRLRQIIINLVNNAIKFTEKGHVVVRVASEGDHKDRHRIRLAVSDTGPGIPRNKQQMLFKAFNQADASTSRRYGGTGLGLVICQRLVHRMGGKIQLESVEGEGSTFSVLIDLETDPKADPNDDGVLDSGHAWVFEPNELTRLSVGHRLERWGIDVHDLSPDAELPERPSSDEPLVVMLTYEENKEAWLQSVIRHCQERDVPVLLMARHNDHTPGLRRLEDQVAAVATKPVRYQRLFSLCNGLLQLGIPDGRTDSVRLPRILVVDDNEINRRLLVTFLADFGIQPDEAEDGSQAMAHISQHTYDLVFMDIQMPVMDGVTATREIRRHEKSDQRLPVVALTAHALPQEREELMRSGFDDYLTKPISEQQLAETVRYWSGFDLQRHRDTQRFNAQATFSKPVAQEADRPASEPATDAPVDFQLGLQRAGGKTSLAHDMFAGLLEQLRANQTPLANAYKEQDWDALLEAVHGLHGVTRYCGTSDLENSLRALEGCLKQRSTQEAQIPLSFENAVKQIERVLHWSEHTDWRQLLEVAATDQVKYQ